MIQIEIDGEPIAWARPGHKRFKKQGEYVDIIYDKQKKLKEMVQWQMDGQFKDDILLCPLRVYLIFRMPIPKSVSAVIRREMVNGIYEHSKRPDIDNMTKFYLDCMNGHIFKDDGQICSLHVEKVYSQRPSTYIRIIPVSRNNRVEFEEEEQETKNDDHTRDDGWGDLHRDHPEQKRPSSARGKEDRIIPFGNG